MQNSLVSATKWLSSTAIRLFSSSSDDVNGQDGPSHKKFQNKLVTPKGGRGRPRKDPNAPKVPRFIPEQRDLGKRRASVMRSRENPDDNGPQDGETRFLLTINALPKNLQIIAKTLYPSTHNKYEEHRLVCKILSEENQSRPNEIFIPTFRKISRTRVPSEKRNIIKEKEQISDEECLQRHRPLELAERRERRREEELLRYELYIRKLSKEYPELLNRKYPITSDGTLSSLDH